MSGEANLSSVTPESLIEIKRRTIEVLKLCMEQLAPEARYDHPAYDAVRRAVAEMAYAVKAIQITVDMESDLLKGDHERHEHFLKREADREEAWNAARAASQGEFPPLGEEPDESK